MGVTDDKNAFSENRITENPDHRQPPGIDRGNRRMRARIKQAYRMRMLRDLGEQGGLIYERHIEKIHCSSGYMRTGNVSHYVQVGPRRKTRKRNRYGKVFMPSKTDRAKLESMCDERQDYLP